MFLRCSLMLFMIVSPVLATEAPEQRARQDRAAGVNHVAIVVGIIVINIGLQVVVLSIPPASFQDPRVNSNDLRLKKTAS